MTGITAIHLYREGKKVIVAVEVGGKWVPVISEDHDSPFSHIIEGRGIETELARHGVRRRDRW